MNGFLNTTLYNAFKNELDAPIIIDEADNDKRLIKLYEDFEKRAGIEDIKLKNELFTVVFTHATEYERQGFEQGFKLGMKTAIATLYEPDTTE